MDGKRLVEDARAAVERHRISWGALVPSPDVVNLDAEGAEEAAYAEMAQAKRRLRHHIAETYGLTMRELAELARP